MDSKRPYGYSFVAPGNPGPPGPPGKDGTGVPVVTEDSALTKLRRLVARRTPLNMHRYIDPHIAIKSVNGQYQGAAGNTIHWWDAPNPVYRCIDAFLQPYAQWNGANAPGFNTQTGVGASHINAHTVETIVSSRVGGVFAVLLYGTGGGDVIVMVDDHPLTDGFTVLASGMPGVFCVNLDVAPNLEGKKFSFRVPSTVGFMGFVRDSTVNLVAPTPKPFNVALVADSMGQAHMFPAGVDGRNYQGTAAQDLCFRMQERTGWAWWNFSQGSTGPAYNGGGQNTSLSGSSEFSSTSRMDMLEYTHKAIAPGGYSLVTILGSVNDGGRGYTAAAYKAHLKSYYAELNNRLPKVPLAVIGPESGITFGFTDIAMLNQATKDACAESPNVALFMDYYGENWFTGLNTTGMAGHAVDDWANDGTNFDVAQSTDRVHLSWYGKKMLSEIIDNRMAQA